MQAVEYAKLFDTDLLNESDLKEVGITYDQLNILKETRSAISINIEAPIFRTQNYLNITKGQLEITLKDNIDNNINENIMKGE